MRARRALAVGAVAAALVACSYTKEDDDVVTPSSGLDDTAPVEPVPTAVAPDQVDLGQIAITLLEIAEVDQPTALAARAGDQSLYVAEQGGEVRRIEVTSSSRNTTTTERFALEGTALDISDEVLNDGEQGLLGLTFSTDGNRMYVAYTGEDARQYLVEFTMGASSADERSRREILVLDDPYPNHNGGQIAFGPDGYLYWGMGDGGGAGDPEQTGQDPNDLLGSVLRIDPDVAPEDATTIGYAIPNGNPFVAGGGAPEVWAYGLRNPWRFSFDRATGDLWIGDVGQDSMEEIDVLLATNGGAAGRGANLGWPIMEGDRPYTGGAPPEGSVAPVFSYGRETGACSVTGGYVYRGARIPAMVGVYLFADFCEGRIRALTQRDGVLVDHVDLGVTVASPTSFGEDAAGELYVLSQAGEVYRITAG